MSITSKMQVFINFTRYFRMTDAFLSSEQDNVDTTKSTPIHPAFRPRHAESLVCSMATVPSMMCVCEFMQEQAQLIVQMSAPKKGMG